MRKDTSDNHTNEQIDIARITEMETAWTREQLLAVIAGLRDGVAVETLDDENRIHCLLANDRYYEINRITGEQLSVSGEVLLSALHPDDRALVIDRIRRVLKTGEPDSFRYRCVEEDGGVFWLRSDASAARIIGMDEPVLISIVTDVSHIVRLEQDVERYAAQMQMIVDNVGSGVTAVVLREDNQVEPLLVTDRYYELLGYTKEQYRKELKNPFMPINPDDMDRVVARTRALNQSGGTETLEYKAMRRDGKEIFLQDTISMIRLPGVDKPVQLSVFTDITSSRVQTDRLKALTENIPGGIAALRVEAGGIHIDYFNEGFCRFSGYTREEFGDIMRENPLKLIFEEDVPMARQALAEFQAGNESVSVAYRCHTKDGGYRWLELRGSLADRRSDGLRINLIQLDVTESRLALEKLRISEKEYRLAIDQSGRLIYRYNHSDNSVDLTESVAHMFGLPCHLTNVPDALIENGMVAEESQERYRTFYEAIRRGDRSGSMTILRKTSDGNWRWYEGSFQTVYGDDINPVSAIVVFVDATEQREKEAVYRRWQQSLRAKMADSYTLFRWNLSRDVMIGEAEGALINFHMDKAMSSHENSCVYARCAVAPEDRERYIAFLDCNAMLAGYIRGKRTEQLDYREIRPEGEGEPRWLRLTVEMVTFPGNADICAYLMYEDVDKEKRLELTARELAETDPLTGVLNRVTFAKRVQKLIDGMAPEERCAMLMLDVDGFKLLNDSFGHAAGDQALIDIANVLRSILRQGDLVGRLGGDEFLVCLTNMYRDGDIEKKAERICEQIHKAYSLEVQISASVGIVVCPRDGREFEALYRKADAALYTVKESGKDSYAFYQEGMRMDAQPAPERTETEPSVLDKLRPPKRRMLIVEDSSMDAELLASIFRDEYVIEKAKDGKSALIRLRHYGTAVSVVLLDLFMPGMDGFEVLGKMHASPEMQAIPVIVVSGSDDRETSLRVIRSGATDFISKPIDPDLLRIRVKSAVSKAENERLRAQNSYLSLENDSIRMYRAALESVGAVVVENNWQTGAFTYDANISSFIYGKFDNRPFWYVLLSEQVADAMTVKNMQTLVYDVGSDRSRKSGNMTVLLKTPSGEKRRFRMNVTKLVNEFQLTSKVILTFNNLDSMAAMTKE